MKTKSKRTVKSHTKDTSSTKAGPRAERTARSVHAERAKGIQRAPRAKDAPGRALLQVWLELDLYDWAKKQAKKEFRTMSAWLRMLLNEKRAAKR